ncbi:MAG: MaoC family dehydratase, partial [Cycloclasticus sp.]|nr:MaoC family dehydratase [Cycloclasticus sp.]
PSFQVSHDVVDKYIKSTNDLTKQLKVKDNEGDSVSPPMLAAVYVIDALRTRVGPPGGIHAKQTFKFHRPAKIGETLFTSATVLRLYQKKERNYVEMTTETLNQHGDLITTGLITRIWGKE